MKVPRCSATAIKEDNTLRELEASAASDPESSCPMNAFPPAVIAVIKTLESGAFDELCGLSEENYVDVKLKPYFTNGQASNDKQKAELAKDVAAFVNLHGGIILIGAAATKDPHTKREVVSDIAPFPQSDLDVEQYQKILAQWLVPSIAGLEIRWYPSAADALRGIVAILIPGLAEKHGPFLTRKSVDSEGKIEERYFAIFTRRGTDNRPLTVESLQSLLRAGKLNDKVHERLVAIEEKLLELKSTEKTVPAKVTLPVDSIVARNRIERGKIVCQRSGLPNITLTAMSATGTSIPSLFRSSSDPVVQLFNALPVLRQKGFSIRAFESSVMVDGTTRRSVDQGACLLELWKDGFFMAIGPADYDLLCWAKTNFPDKGLPLRNFVLAEVVLNFVVQAASLYKFADPAPMEIEFHLELSAMTTKTGHRCTLSTNKDNAKFFPMFDNPKEAPGDTIQVGASVKTAATDPIYDIGRVTYDLLSQTYVKFGFHEADTPYVESTGNRVTPESLLGSDLGT